MAVSGVTDFNLVLNEIVEQAFHKLGKAAEGEAMTPRMYSDGKNALNLLIKTWGAMPHLWTETEGTLALVANQAQYTISPKPMRITSMRRRQNGIDTPMDPMARSDYFDQPNKTVSASIPTSFYYDPQQATGVLYLWPAPSAQTTTQFTINYTYMRRMDDMISSTDSADLPQEWLEALVWNLANRLETEYPINNPTRAAKVERIAASLFANLKAFDNEPTSIFLQPDNRMYRRAS